MLNKIIKGVFFMFDNMKIKTRLRISYLIMLIFMLIIMGISIQGLKSSNKRMEHFALEYSRKSYSALYYASLSLLIPPHSNASHREHS